MKLYGENMNEEHLKKVFAELFKDGSCTKEEFKREINKALKSPRYVDDGYEAIEEQSFTDSITGKTYYVDYFDEIIDLVNQQDMRIRGLEDTIENHIEFLINSAHRLGFQSLDHLLYTLNEGEIYSYSTANWQKE